MNTFPKIPIVFILSSILFLVYVGSVPTTLPDADAGEFILLAKYPGIAHPPGYPLYVSLLRWVADWKMSPPLVYQLAMVSVVAAVGAAAVLFGLFRMLQLPAVWSALGIFVVFTAPGIWRVANTTEPFALTLLLIAMALTASYQCLRSKREPGPVLGWIALLGALYGLGLASHHVMVLYAPLTALCMVIAVYRLREKIRWALVGVVTFLAAFFVGALPVLTLFRDETGAVLSWGPLRTWKQLWSHLIREDYGTLTLSASDEVKHGMVQFFWTELPFEIGFLFFVLLVVGIGLGVSRRAWRELDPNHRIFSCGLLGTLALIGFGFYSLCNVSSSGMGETIVRRFFHASYIPLAYFLVRGIDFQFNRLSNHDWVRAVAASILLLATGVHVSQQGHFCDRSTENFAEHDVWNIFHILADHKQPILVTFSDAEILAAFYGQGILGLGKDVTVVHPAIWVHGPYRRKVLSQMGLDPRVAIDWQQAVQLAGKKRPVFFASSNPEIEKWPGKMIARVRLLQWFNDKQQKITKQVAEQDMSKFAYSLERPPMGSELSPWEANLFSRYALWYQTVVNSDVN